MTASTSNLVILREKYRSTLLDNIVPFWMKHAIDPDGGINTCLNDDGMLVSRDRWSWSQWRALWIFSKLYRCIEPSSQWLDIAQGIFSFTTSHGPLDNGHWPLLLDGDGNVKRAYESIYSDAFAILGLTEYWKVTQNPNALKLAVETFHAVQQAFTNDALLPAWPYPIPVGCKPHSLSMIFSLAYHELAEVTGDEQIRVAALDHHHMVMSRFLRPRDGVVLEWLKADGSEQESPLGTVVCPGHAVESMWFQIHIARSMGDHRIIQNAVDAIRRHLELGWDSKFGGLFLAVDANGSDHVEWPHAEAKLWWPHTEALYATLLAYEITEAPWCLEWHEKIHDYSFSHYPVERHGEWKQRLDRQGRPMNTVVALPVKDPFHLPRALIYCIEVLERLIENPHQLKER